MPPVPPLLPPFSVLQNSLGLPSATRHQRGGVSVWRSWVPMRREAQFFLSSAMSELPWSSYSCPSLFIFTLSWRDASTSSPTLELQVSFYFVEQKKFDLNLQLLLLVYSCFFPEKSLGLKDPRSVQRKTSYPWVGQQKHHAKVASFLASWCKTWFSADFSNHGLIGWWFDMLF